MCVCVEGEEGWGEGWVTVFKACSPFTCNPLGQTLGDTKFCNF